MVEEFDIDPDREVFERENELHNRTREVEVNEDIELSEDFIRFVFSGCSTESRDYIHTIRESLEEQHRQHRNEWESEMMQNPVVEEPEIPRLQEGGIIEGFPIFLRGHQITPPEVFEGGEWMRDSAPKKHPLDLRHPHKCYNCKRKIQYEHALKIYMEQDGFHNKRLMISDDTGKNPNVIEMFKIAEEQHKRKKQFNRWWREPIVQFLCCSCIASPFAELEYKTRERLGDGE